MSTHVSRQVSTALLSLALLLGGLAQPAGAADPVTVTLLHTNDLHSHFRGESTPLGLGGVARLKTEISRLRAEKPNSLLLDGGDWSEGNIFYNLGAGVETLRMMEHLGYDVAVVGNHDWFNGADTLLSIIDQAQPSMSLLATNVSTGEYARADDFNKSILPYVIKEVGGVRIAFIGLLTYEFVYDGFFAPIKIVEPFSITRELAARLKKKADAVVVISHNAIALNEQLLRMAPDVDLVIGAHDHVKLSKPRVVTRVGAPDAWVVEAGCWGRYLGRVDMKVTPRGGGPAPTAPAVELLSYGLTQMDSTIAEDPATVTRVAALQKLIESRYGPIFHDEVAENHTEIDRTGAENMLGNLTTDAYNAYAHADFALDQVNLIYGELHEGRIHTADVFNANPAIYSPLTQKSWTLHTFPIKGRTLNWLLNVLYSSKQLAQLGILSSSGMQITYNPFITSRTPEFTTPFPALNAFDEKGIVNEILIGGNPLQSDRQYKVAAGGGIIYAVNILNSIFPGAVPLDSMVDTGAEDWRVLADHVHALSPITPDKLPLGKRVRSQQTDLGIAYDDVSWEPRRATGRRPLFQFSPLGARGFGAQSMPAHVKVTVHNFGLTPSAPAGSTIRLYANRNGTNTAVDPDLVQIGADQPIPGLGYLESRTFEWDVVIPGDHDLYPLTAAVNGVAAEVNHSNDSATHWFSERQR